MLNDKFNIYHIIIKTIITTVKYFIKIIFVFFNVMINKSIVYNSFLMFSSFFYFFFPFSFFFWCTCVN